MMGLLVGLLILSLNFFELILGAEHEKHNWNILKAFRVPWVIYIRFAFHYRYFEWEINLYRKILYLFWCDYKFDGALLWEFLSVSVYFHSFFLSYLVNVLLTYIYYYNYFSFDWEIKLFYVIGSKGYNCYSSVISPPHVSVVPSLRINPPPHNPSL